MTSEFSKRAIKDISKGAKRLRGNLRGLLRFKDKSFPDHRVVGAQRGETVVLMLCCESRNTVYKNKEDMVKAERKNQH